MLLLELVRTGIGQDSTTMPVITTTPLPTDTAAIADLLKARGRIAERLKQNPDFQALNALDATIHALRGAIAAEGRAVKGDPEKGVLSGLSQADGAFEILNNFTKPFPIADLVEIMELNGLKVGGKDPTINLSSTLSKDARFVSVRHQGRPCWWLAGRTAPETNAADTESAA